MRSSITLFFFFFWDGSLGRRQFIRLDRKWVLRGDYVTLVVCGLRTANRLTWRQSGSRKTCRHTCLLHCTSTCHMTAYNVIMRLLFLFIFVFHLFWFGACACVQWRIKLPEVKGDRYFTYFFIIFRLENSFLFFLCWGSHPKHFSSAGEVCVCGWGSGGCNYVYKQPHESTWLQPQRKPKHNTLLLITRGVFISGTSKHTTITSIFTPTPSLCVSISRAGGPNGSFPCTSQLRQAARATVVINDLVCDDVITVATHFQGKDEF